MNRKEIENTIALVRGYNLPRSSDRQDLLISLVLDIAEANFLRIQALEDRLKAHAGDFHAHEL